MKIPEFLLSSTGEGVALRWKSLAAGIIPSLILLGSAMGYDFEPGFAQNLSEGVEKAIIGMWELASVYAFIYGLIRRNMMKKKGEGKFAEPFI